MPSNVFLYQLKQKGSPLNPGDRFLIEDNISQETRITPLSCIAESMFSTTGINFRIKNGNLLQIKEMGPSANVNKFRTIVSFNGTLALSGIYED